MIMHKMIKKNHFKPYKTPFSWLRMVKHTHIRATHLCLLALVFVYEIPIHLYLTLLLIYFFYIFLCCGTVPGFRCVSDDVNLSHTNSPRRNQTLLFASKRLQQIWFAMKRFSPIHRPKEYQNNLNHNNQHSTTIPSVTKPRKYSINCETERYSSHTDSSVTGSPCKLTWSPFTKRKQTDNNKKYRLYSSHPNIVNLNEEEQFGKQNVIMDETKLNYINASNRKDPISNPMVRSPLNRIKKIKRDVQRCVHRVTSSDHELSEGNEMSEDKMINKNKLIENSVELVSTTETTTISTNLTRGQIRDLNGNSIKSAPDSKRKPFQKCKTLDPSSIFKSFEEEIVQVEQQSTISNRSVNQNDISLEKVQNYVSVIPLIYVVDKKKSKFRIK